MTIETISLRSKKALWGAFLTPDACRPSLKYSMNPLKLRPVNPQVCGVHTSAGAHVGNLKLIGGVWKFKAIGVDANGHVIPGGGPLTGRHNTVFAVLDEAAISAALMVY